MPDVVLSDLLAWEPRLSDARRRREDLDPEVSWVISARLLPPMLPGLRGGEVVILPENALRSVGTGIEPLLGHLVEARVAAAVVPSAWRWERAAALPAGLVCLDWSGDQLGAEAESEMNRRLTERRGAMYRAGMEFGRLLTGMTTAGASAEELVRRTATTTGHRVELRSRTGLVLAAAGPEPETHPGRAAEVELGSGNRLRLVPPDAGESAINRMYAERLGLALDAAASRAERERPRGPVRAAAVRALLTREAALPLTDVAAVAARLAVPQNGTYRVVLVAQGHGQASPEGWLGGYGALHEAGRVDGAFAWLAEQRGDRASSRSVAARPALPRTAISAAVGLAEVPTAARQARYLLRLLASGEIAGPVARFDDVSVVGAHRLLFDLWGEPALGEFVRGVLGRLPEEDRRGDLRETLLAFLQAGGSQVDAAARLGIHRNTLAYRLRRVAEETGSDPTDPARRLAFHLALLASRLPEPLRFGDEGAS